jgi:phosphohistidine phosphatase
MTVDLPEGHRRLILTRHAKSDWGQKGLADHDRPLNPRGRRAAAELGQWLTSRGYVPDQILCSDAMRTRETWALTGLTGTPEYLSELYHAAPEVMMAALRRATGPIVMMLGHNPGIAAFAASLPAEPPHHEDFTRYPTAATLVVDFEIGGWAEVEAKRGSALDFFVPGDRG